MKIFKLKRKQFSDTAYKNVELTIKDRIDDYSCYIDLKIENFCDVKNVKANIMFRTNQPGRMFLNFDIGCATEVELLIRDRSNKHDYVGRKIADYIWENIQLKKYDGTAISYTSLYDDEEEINVDFLIKNKDFLSMEEFQNSIKEQKDVVINFLEWRINGGSFKNELISDEYILKCKSVLEYILNLE